MQHVHNRSNGPATWLVMTGLLLVAPACLSPAERDKRAAASELVTAVTLPTLDDCATRATALDMAIQTLVATPGQDTLAAAQQAWRLARRPWKEAEAFVFGPASDLRIAPAIDRTIDPSTIESEIAGTATFDDAYIETRGASRKGFHAIESLLFRAGDDTAVLASLTTDAQAARRRDYLAALAQNLARKVAELRLAWALDGDRYADLVANPGAKNTTYPTGQSVIDAFVNESVYLSELVADTRLARPMGATTGGTPRPDLEESGPSDNSLADMTGNLQGIRNVYLGARDGATGRGISRLVAAQNPATDQAVRQAITAALDAVGAIPRPYRTALVEERAEVDSAFDAVKALQRALGTEVVALLGVTLKFNGNDGD